jgi:hypothetical protein
MSGRLDPATALKVAIWCIPVLFGLGAMYQTMLGSSADVATVVAGLDKHESLDSHPVTGAKLEIIVVEQRALRDDVAEQAVSIAAICQATGAQCR